MSGLNNNYVTSLLGFDDENYGEFPDNVDTFNANGLDDFLAFCLFLIRGEYQLPNQDVEATPAFLFGNEDTVNNTGWSLQILPGGTGLAGTAEDPVLVARYGTGAAFNFAQLPLSETPVAGPGGRAGYIERLILATIGRQDSGDDTYVALSVNGAVANSVEAGEPYAPSVLPCRVGLSPGGINEASDIEIVACGYSRGNNLLAGNGLAGLPANAFRVAREQYSGGYLTTAGSLDWLHRWQAFSPNQGTIGKTAQGATTTSRPPAPAELADLGSNGVSNVLSGAVEAPVPMTLNGALTVDQRRNPDWYQGGAFRFLGEPG